MSERLIDLQQTKGTFEVRGIVTGTDKDKFYEEKTTGKGKEFRSVNFGVKVDKDSTVYVGLQGFTRDDVVFYKRPDKKAGTKGESQKVPWGKRFTFKKDGFSLIGTNVGVTKVLDDKGKYVNDKKTLAEYDACKEIGDNLKDDESVFIKGNLDYSSFEDGNGNTRRNVKLAPSQISLCSKDVDFSAEDYKPMHDFTQTIIFMGINKEKDDEDKETGRFIISAKIVNYNSIEDAEFITENPKLANVMRKTLKPYNAIEIYGKISAGAITEEVTVDDDWGAANEMKRVSGGYKREFIVTGADKDSIDTALYSEATVEAAIAKVKASKAAKEDYGSDDKAEDGWGAAKEATDEDDEW